MSGTKRIRPETEPRSVLVPCWPLLRLTTTLPNRVLVGEACKAQPPTASEAEALLRYDFALS